MVRKTRADNVTDYLNDFCGGQKFYGADVSRETIVANVAEEVIAWHDLIDTISVQYVYRAVVRRLLDEGILALRETRATGGQFIEVA